MKVEFGAFAVFGSGSAGARLTIDGVAVTREVCEARGWPVSQEDNGFVGWELADIPVSTLLSIRKVDFIRAARPGRTIDWSCSGRSFVKRAAGGGRPVMSDRLILAAMDRPNKAANRRWQRRWTQMKTWALETGRARVGGSGLEWRVPVRLPDGCRGARWEAYEPPEVALAFDALHP